MSRSRLEAAGCDWRLADEDQLQQITVAVAAWLDASTRVARQSDGRGNGEKLQPGPGAPAVCCLCVLDYCCVLVRGRYLCGLVLGRRQGEQEPFGANRASAAGASSGPSTGNAEQEPPVWPRA